MGTRRITDETDGEKILATAKKVQRHLQRAQTSLRPIEYLLRKSKNEKKKQLPVKLRALIRDAKQLDTIVVSNFEMW